MYKHIAYLSQYTDREQQEHHFDHFMGLLDYWAHTAPLEKQKKIFAERDYSNDINPYLAVWWFKREQNDQNSWQNSWPAEDFTRYMFHCDPHPLFYPYALQRMEWAIAHKEDKFFDAWIEHSTFASVSTPTADFIRHYTREDADNPIFINIVRYIYANSPQVYRILTRHLPVTYLQENNLPHADKVVAHQKALEELKTKAKNFNSKALTSFAQWRALLEDLDYPSKDAIWTIGKIWKQYDEEMSDEDHMDLCRWFTTYWNDVFEEVFPSYEEFKRMPHEKYWWMKSAFDFAPQQARKMIEVHCTEALNHLLHDGRDGVNECIEFFEYDRAIDPHHLLNHPITVNYWELLDFNDVMQPVYDTKWHERLAQLDTLAPPGLVGLAETLLDFLFDSNERTRLPANIVYMRQPGCNRNNSDYKDAFENFIQQGRLFEAVNCGEGNTVSGRRKI